MLSVRIEALCGRFRYASDPTGDPKIGTRANLGDPAHLRQRDERGTRTIVPDPGRSLQSWRHPAKLDPHPILESGGNPDASQTRGMRVLRTQTRGTTQGGHSRARHGDSGVMDVRRGYARGYGRLYCRTGRVLLSWPRQLAPEAGSRLATPARTHRAVGFALRLFFCLSNNGLFRCHASARPAPTPKPPSRQREPR